MLASSGERMQIDTQRFLRLVERTSSIVFLDIEANGLRGDYNSMLCASIKQYGLPPITYAVRSVCEDKSALLKTRDALERAECWVTYYGKGFDIKMINTRLLRHGLRPIHKRPHIDLYYQLKSKTIMSRRSQGHYLSWLKLEQQKMTVSADDWSRAAADWNKGVKTRMIERCESDVEGLECLYERTKHLISDISC